MKTTLHRDWWNQICKKGKGAKAIRKALAFRYMYVVACRFEELNGNTWFSGPTTWKGLANYLTKSNDQLLAKKRVYKTSGKDVTTLTQLDLLSTSVALGIDPREFQMSPDHWLKLIVGYLITSNDNEELDTKLSFQQNVENFLSDTVPNNVGDVQNMVDLALEKTQTTHALFERDSYRGYSENEYKSLKELIEKLQEIIENDS